MILWWGIGGGRRMLDGRQVAYIDADRGWPLFFRNQIDPAIEWSVSNGHKPRIWLHNPFGMVAGEKMPFTQAADTADQKYFDGLAALIRSYPDVEFVLYIGSPHNSKSFVGANAAGRLELMYFSLMTILDSGASIGLDAVNSQPATSHTFKMANLLRTWGANVYIEATPELGQTHWAPFKRCITNKLFSRRHEQDTQLKKNAGKYPIVGSSDWYQSETCVFINARNFRNNPEEWEPRSNQLVDWGLTPVVSWALVRNSEKQD